MTDDPIPVRIERCACGGFIAADPLDCRPRVEAHQRSEIHRQWWDAGGMDIVVVRPARPSPRYRLRAVRGAKA